MASKTYRCHECGKRRVGVTVVKGRDLCPECAEAEAHKPQYWQAIVPVRPTIAEEGMAWVDEKCREYGHVVGLAVVIAAADEYELARKTFDLENEINSSGYGTIGPIQRPTWVGTDAP